MYVFRYICVHAYVSMCVCVCSLNLLFCTFIFYFTITAFPRVSAIKMSGETVAGRRVNLTCSGNGDPEPTYTWYRQDENGKHYLSLKSSDSS